MEKHLLAEGAHFFDQAFHLPVLGDGFGKAFGLRRGKRHGHRFGFHLARPAPGAGRVIAGHAALADPVQGGECFLASLEAGLQSADLRGGKGGGGHGSKESGGSSATDAPPKKSRKRPKKLAPCDAYIYAVRRRFATPFFAGFHRHLFGTPPRSALDQLLPQAHAARSASQLRTACGEFIPDALLPKAASKLNSRARVFTPLVTFWAFLAQVLARGSCRDAVRGLLAHLPARPESEPGLSTSTAAYCRARARLPLAMLQKVFNAVRERLRRDVPRAALWLGHRVCLVDGSTASMPDQPENQARWPQSANQKPGCGFPTLKMVGLFCLHSGALLYRACGRLRESEQSLARQLWRWLKKGDVLLGDRGFCSYLDLCQLQARGVEVVVRLHGSRRPDFRKGQRLGASDRLMTWERPRAGSLACTPEEEAALPATLTVRYVRYRVARPGFRTRQVVLVTTLLDPQRYPLAALAELYRRRWEIELHWRECKTTLGMDILRGQSPAMVDKELLLQLIAYNLVRALMQQASLPHHQPLARLSFKGTLDTFQRFAAAMHAVAGQPRQRAAILARALEAIAADLLPERPNRVEPRAVKRRPKAYDWLSVPRHQTPAKKAARRAAKKRPQPALS